MDSSHQEKWVPVVANIGVIIGIAVLVYELNQTNRLAETQAEALRLDQIQLAQLAFAESDYLPQISLKAENEGVDSLPAIERSRLRHWHYSVMLRMENHYMHFERGYLDEETGQAILNAASRSLKIWRELDVVLPNKKFEEIVEETADSKR
jgi:hypothetical protein